MKGRQLQATAHLLLAVVVIVLFCPPKSEGSLYGSVSKYRHSAVSSKGIEKLRRYDHLIRYFAGFCYFEPRHRVSPDFIRALILAESGGDALAVSDKNAMGLGQILFETGERAARELATSLTRFRYVTSDRLANLEEGDLFDPAVNILITCYLVAKYNFKFDGRLDLVVSAWNAGEYTESLSQFRHAPYEETEDLIGKVNAYYVFLLNNRIFH